MLGYRSPLGIITGFPRISSVSDWEFKNAEYDVEKMKDNSEPEEDRGFERRLAVDENSSRRTCA
jgi:hypothetical protein